MVLSTGSQGSTGPTIVGQDNLRLPGSSRLRVEAEEWYWGQVVLGGGAEDRPCQSGETLLTLRCLAETPKKVLPQGRPTLLAGFKS
jgi:hypothetical protein